MKKYFFIAVALLIMSAGVAKAQVTIGATTDPHDFSILELISGGERALRLPQMNTDQRDALILSGNSAAPGLEIFNTKCVETWNGSKWIQTCPPEGPRPKEEIRLTIKTTAPNEIYYIPTSGYVGGTYYHAYDWNVYFDDDDAVYKTRNASTIDHNGIEHTFQEAGDHKIRITPYARPFTAGWGNAFGHKNDNIGNANTAANKQKLISIDAPLTTMAFAPKTSENTSGTNASHMFANMFYGCENLTTGAKIVDTYQLPPTITNLSYFLYETHRSNTNLKEPIDLSGLSGWFSGNESITNLSYFLYQTHWENKDLKDLKDPIDLDPIEDWFRNNQKIENLSNFLHRTYYNNTALETTIDLTPLKYWFRNNQKIENLSYFLYQTNTGNFNLTSTINLTPLEEWFYKNESITDLARFLTGIHDSNNPNITSTIDLTPLKYWFINNNKITNLEYFLHSIHAGNFNLTSAINLTPLEGWFYKNESITNLSYFLSSTHQGNTILTSTINLTPLKY